MTVVLHFARSLSRRRVMISQEQRGRLKARLAAALRRGADRRFAEQRERIERTGCTGVF